jgi:hypothetical protein
MKDSITRESSRLCLEACDYVIIALDKLGFSIDRGIFGSLKSSAKIFKTSCILFSLFASFLTSFEPFLQIIGAFLGMTQRLWMKKVSEDIKTR